MPNPQGGRRRPAPPAAALASRARYSLGSSLGERGDVVDHGVALAGAHHPQVVVAGRVDGDAERDDAVALGLLQRLGRVGDAVGRVAAQRPVVDGPADSRRRRRRGSGCAPRGGAAGRWRGGWPGPCGCTSAAASPPTAPTCATTAASAKSLATYSSTPSRPGAAEPVDRVLVAEQLRARRRSRPTTPWRRRAPSGRAAAAARPRPTASRGTGSCPVRRPRRTAPAAAGRRASTSTSSCRAGTRRRPHGCRAPGGRGGGRRRSSRRGDRPSPRPPRRGRARRRRARGASAATSAA